MTKSLTDLENYYKDKGYKVDISEGKEGTCIEITTEDRIITIHPRVVPSTIDFANSHYRLYILLPQWAKRYRIYKGGNLNISESFSELDKVLTERYNDLVDLENYCKSNGIDFQFNKDSNTCTLISKKNNRELCIQGIYNLPIDSRDADCTVSEISENGEDRTLGSGLMPIHFFNSFTRVNSLLNGAIDKLENGAIRIHLINEGEGATIYCSGLEKVN